MPIRENLKNAPKFGLRAGLSAAVVATTAAKYGVHFSFGLTKCLLNGASSLAGQFAGSSFKACIGDFMLSETEKGINSGFDKLISFEKSLKGKIR